MACEQFFTQAFTEQISARRARGQVPNRGRNAIRECRDEHKALATSVEIEHVAVKDAAADASIRPQGGELPLETATIGLRKTGGDWQLDRLKDGTLDRPAFFAFGRRELTSPSLSRSVADCALRDLKTNDDETIERMLLKPDARLFVMPVVICSVRDEISRQRLPTRVGLCVARRLRHEVTRGTLGRRLDRDPANASVFQTPTFKDVVKQITLGCLSPERRSGARRVS